MANTKKYVSFDKLSLYDEKIKKVISDADAAAVTSAVSTANAYADSLAVNYDAAGAAATAESNAKGYTDAEIVKVNEVVAGVKTTAEQGVTNAATAQAAAVAAQAAADKAQGEVDALELVVKNIQENAYDDTEIRGMIDGLNSNKADKTQVATDIAAAVKVETDARVEAVAGVQGAVDALSGTHATDKKALEDAIALKADQTALNEVSAVANAAVKQSDYDVKIAALEDEDTRIEGLVTAEAERAAGVESGLNERLEGVEAFFKLAEGETLDTALDTLKEIQTYITTEGAAADQMVLDIAANAKAIEDMDAAYKAADVALDERLDVLEAINHEAYKAADEVLAGRIDVLEKIDHEAYVAADTALKNELNGEIAKKADASALTSAVEALEGADSAMAGRLDAIEAQLGDGEGSVADMIADAKQEAIDSAVGTAAADATSKANAAEAAAKGHADSLNTAMDARVVALEAIDHDHANKAELDLIVSGDKAKWDAAAAIAHSHENASVLNGITAENVTTWNTVTSKAAQADLTAVGDRVTAIETWHSNFVEVSEEEINSLFAVKA